MKLLDKVRAALQPLTVLAITIFNRGAGYLRDMLMTAALGTTPASQVFVYAFRVFGIVRALTSEGAIPAVVVDRMVKAGHGRDWSAARSFTLAEWGTWWIFLFACTVAIAIANPFLMLSLIPADIYAFLQKDIWLFSILLGLGLALNSAGAIYPSIFQAQSRFFFHSALYSLINIGFIILFALVWVFDIADANTVSLLICLAFLGSGLVQIAVAALLVKQPLQHVLWPFGSLAEIPKAFMRFVYTLRQMGPIAMFNATSPLAAVLATAVLVRGKLNITQFFVAERLVQLLPGTLGYAIGVVVLPMIARQRKSDSKGAGNGFLILIGCLAFFGAIGSVGLYLFSAQAIAILYQRFNFSAADAAATAAYLQGISLSALPLLLEQALANRLFAFMHLRANHVLFVGSAIACVAAWLGSSLFARTVGIGVSAEACGVFVFIVSCRVALLLTLNIMVARRDTSHT